MALAQELEQEQGLVLVLVREQEGEEAEEKGQEDQEGQVVLGDQEGQDEKSGAGDTARGESLH